MQPSNALKAPFAIGSNKTPLQKIKTQHVEAVLIDGEIVYADERFTKVNRGAVLTKIADVLSVPRSPAEVARRELGLAVFLHVKPLFPRLKAFYEGYISGGARELSYQNSSCV